MAMRPIETRYKGYRFRSRLEARWAVFFDALGLKWEYEPEGFELPSGRYLPDFKVHYPDEGAQWFEVKGDLSQVSQHEWKRMLDFNAQKRLLVLDGTPSPKMYCTPEMLLGGYDGEPVQAPYRLGHEGLSGRRFGYALWSYKQRPWCDEHCNFFDPDSGFEDDVLEIELACAAARSARFEHGEVGAPAFMPLQGV